jgi:hypothetical protein
MPKVTKSEGVAVQLGKNETKWVQLMDFQQNIFCVQFSSGQAWSLVLFRKKRHNVDCDSAINQVSNSSRDNQCPWTECTKVFGINIAPDDPSDVDELVDNCRNLLGVRIVPDTLPSWVPFRNEWVLMHNNDILMIEKKRSIVKVLETAADKEGFGITTISFPSGSHSVVLSANNVL